MLHLVTSPGTTRPAGSPCTALQPAGGSPGMELTLHFPLVRVSKDGSTLQVLNRETGVWFWACHDSFNLTLASAACKQLGYNRYLCPPHPSPLAPDTLGKAGISALVPVARPGPQGSCLYPAAQPSSHQPFLSLPAPGSPCNAHTCPLLRARAGTPLLQGHCPAPSPPGLPSSAQLCPLKPVPRFAAELPALPRLLPAPAAIPSAQGQCPSQGQTLPFMPHFAHIISHGTPSMPCPSLPLRRETQHTCGTQCSP